MAKYDKSATFQALTESVLKAARAAPGSREAFGPRGLSNIAWACARLTLGNDSPLFHAIAGASVPRIKEFSEQDLSNIAWACATLIVRDLPLFAAISSASVEKMPQFTPQGLANTAWSVATLSVADAPLLQAIAVASLSQIQQFRPQELSNIAWSYATLRFFDAPLLEAISGAVQAKITAFNERDLAEIAWSFASLSCKNMPLIYAIASQAVLRRNEFSAKHLSNLAWAMATWAVPHQPLLKAIAAAAVLKIDEFTPQGLSNTAWACAALRMKEPPLLEAISLAARASISEFTGQNLSNTAWAFATLAYEDRPLFAAISKEAVQQITELQEQNIANLAWAFAALGIKDVPLLSALASAALPLIRTFSLQGMANMAWALAEMSILDEPLLKAIAGEALPKLKSYFVESAAGFSSVDPRAVLSIAQGFAASGQLSEEVYEATRGALQRYAARLDKDAAAASSGAAVEASAGPSKSEELFDEPRVLFKQQDLVVLWKPAGWTVSVSSGPNDEPDEVFGEGDSGRKLQEWVSTMLGRDSPVCLDPARQYGLVHRLDRNTSGGLVCATSYRGFYLAQLEFSARRVRKSYIALCQGKLARQPRMLQAPLGGSRQADGSWKSFVDPNGRQALTELLQVQHLRRAVEDRQEDFSLVEVLLHTGRQHQIRVHLASEGHPLVSDTPYGGTLVEWCPRSFLHAHHLELDVGSGPVVVDCPLPGELRGALEALEEEDASETSSSGRTLLGKWR
mmetsp:Transcript_89038/g.160575  ORF Transcript_89038/g.160575 Transcript_89038/m.160575 type:complete len:741 (+) Transcript_89038:515-2737(+)